MRSTGRDVRVRTFVHIWLPAQSDIPRLDLLVSTIKRDLAIFGKISFNISVNISANYGLRKPLLVYLNRAGSRQMSATPFFTPHHSQPYTVSYDSYCGYNIIPHTRISYPQHRAPQSRPLKREGGNRPQLPSSRRGLASNERISSAPGPSEAILVGSGRLGPRAARGSVEQNKLVTRDTSSG